MEKSFLQSYVFPVATIAGSIIGVGIFSLPYVMSRAGFWSTIFYFIVLTALVVCIHVIFGQICLKTPDYKRFPGFAKYHLGSWGEAAALIISIFGSFGVLLAYLIVGGQFLFDLFSPFLGGQLFYYVLPFFIVASAVAFFGIKKIAKMEFGILFLLVIAMVFVLVKGFSHININNIFISNFKFQISNLFLPYGPIVFALWGTGLIPQAEEMLGAQNKKKFLKRIIIISTLIPAFIYLFFTLLILGITGPNTTAVALTGLKSVLADGIILVALSIGVLITFSAFVCQGFILEQTFVYDLKIKKFYAWVFACFTPMILFMLGLNSFIPLISFLGGVLLGISGILILLMYKKIGGRNIVVYPLSLVFIFGIIYELMFFSR